MTGVASRRRHRFLGIFPLNTNTNSTQTNTPLPSNTSSTDLSSSTPEPTIPTSDTFEGLTHAQSMSSAGFLMEEQASKQSDDPLDMDSQSAQSQETQFVNQVQEGQEVQEQEQDAMSEPTGRHSMTLRSAYNNRRDHHLEVLGENQDQAIAFHLGVASPAHGSNPRRVSAPRRVPGAPRLPRVNTPEPREALRPIATPRRARRLPNLDSRPIATPRNTQHAPSLQLDSNLGGEPRLQLNPSLQDDPDTPSPYGREDNTGLRYEAPFTQDLNLRHDPSHPIRQNDINHPTPQQNPNHPIRQHDPSLQYSPYAQRAPLPPRAPILRAATLYQFEAIPAPGPLGERDFMTERMAEHMAERMPTRLPPFETFLLQPVDGHSQPQPHPPRAAADFPTMTQQARAAPFDEPHPSYLNQHDQVTQAYKSEYVRLYNLQKRTQMKAERVRAGNGDPHKAAALLVKSVTLVTMTHLNYEQMMLYSHPDHLGTALSESMKGWKKAKEMATSASTFCCGRFGELYGLACLLEGLIYGRCHSVANTLLNLLLKASYQDPDAPPPPYQQQGSAAMTGNQQVFIPEDLARGLRKLTEDLITSQRAMDKTRTYLSAQVMKDKSPFTYRTWCLDLSASATYQATGTMVQERNIASVDGEYRMMDCPRVVPKVSWPLSNGMSLRIVAMFVDVCLLEYLERNSFPLLFNDLPE